MRFNLFTCILMILTYAVPSFAEEGGVSFVEGKTFSEILQQAKQENKLVFIDCYTSWCGPCKMMANKVFPQKEMGDYFNPRYVCVKFDMEKGEGVDLKNRYEVKAYPTFLCLDSDGNVLHRVVGGDDNCKAFIERVDAVNTGNSLIALTKRYENGERSSEFMMQYLTALNNAYDKAGAAKVADEILKCDPAEILNDSILFKVFIDHENNLYSDNMQYFLANRDEFTKRYTERTVNRKLNKVWSSHPYSLVSTVDGKKVFDKNGMERYKKELKKWNVENRDQYIAESEILVAQQMGEWKDFSKLCSKFIKKHNAPDMVLYNWAIAVDRRCKDSKVRGTAAQWLDKRIAEIKKEEAANPTPADSKTIKPASNYIPYYEKLINSLSGNVEQD